MAEPAANLFCVFPNSVRDLSGLERRVLLNEKNFIETNKFSTRGVSTMTNRNIIYLTGLIWAVLLLVSCGKNTLSYTSEEKGYRIDYNADWEKKEIDISIVFTSPKESEEDAFQEAVSVVVQDLSVMPMTLEELTGHMEDYLKKADATLEKSEPRTLGGSSGHSLVVTGKQGELELRMMQVYTVTNGKAYIVSYTAEADKYDKYLPDAESMIESFKML